jgi:hypothetical protein
VVKELNATDLSISQPVYGGGVFSIVCGETKVTFTGMDDRGQPLRWAWNLVGGAQQKAAVQAVTPNGITYHFAGMDYRIKLSPHEGSCEQLGDGSIRLNPSSSGTLVLNLNNAR